MFYLHEILKKRGKFGIIWLAATLPNRVSRRDVSTVDIANRSKDIQDIITQYNEGNLRFSLYLSSQLMFGLISVYRIKAAILLEDVKNLATRRFTIRTEEYPNIDLVEPTNAFRVTFDEPDFDNVSLDFGSFSISRTAPVHEPSYEYFIISTPKSPDEWQISPGLPEEYRSIPAGTEDEFRARLEDITMQEDIQDEQAPSQSEEPIIDILGGLTDADLLEQPFSFFATPDIPETEREVPERELDSSVITAVEPQLRVEDLPDVDDQQQGVDSFPQGSTTEPLPERSSAASADIPSVLPSLPDTVRRSVSENGTSSFLLQPINVRGRRGRRHRRRRHLIVDEVTELSRDQMMNNFDTANYRLVRPLDIPHSQESADSMLTRFGLRAAARGNKRFWRNPKTLPEPNDSSPFGMFIRDEARAPDLPDASDSILRRIRESSIPEDDSHRPKSREEARAEETLDDTHGLSATSKTTSLQRSRILHDLPSLSSTTRRSLTGPDITGLDLSRRDDVNLYESLLVDPLMPAETVAPEPEPEPQNWILEPEITLEEGRDISTSQRRHTCIVSPEKTPPPTSPEKPSSPDIEKTMLYIKSAFDETIIPNLITFTSVIRKTPGTRKYVAKLFFVLLDFHASGVLHLQQTEPGEEIFISKGPNFYAFC